MKLTPDNRTTTCITLLSMLLICLWFITWRRRVVDVPLEVTLEAHRSGNAEQRTCIVDTCLKLDQCLIDLDGINVYVQPMVKIRNKKGELMDLPFSREFTQIRQTILSSRFNVDDPRRACFVVPGVDLLNLRKFHSNDEIQRIIESVGRLLPSNSNLLLFNFIGPKSSNESPLHLQHIWASAALDQTTLRRRFDISLPMLRPYDLQLNDTTMFETETNFPVDQQQWSVILRFASETVGQQLRELLNQKDEQRNRTVVFVRETSETERRMTVVQDGDGKQRNYAEILTRSTFTIIHDLVPGFQMILLDAMECGSIPVIISDDYLPPFHEVLDWSQFSFRLAKQNLPHLTRILSSIPTSQLSKMRANSRRVFERYLINAHQLTLATLHLLERRILPVESVVFDEWTSEIEQHKKLWTNVPIRSVASNLSVILAIQPTKESLRTSISSIFSMIPQDHLRSIFVLWPINQRPSQLSSFIDDLGRKFNRDSSSTTSIRLLNWDPVDLSDHLVDFSDALAHQSDISHDCWLFLDFRFVDGTQTRLRHLTPDLFLQAFEAWKENSDSVLSFSPLDRVDTKNEPKEAAEFFVQNSQQTPFYQGAAFIHPQAIKLVGKTDDRWNRCSRIASQSTDCSAKNSDCPELQMQLCRPDLA
ncbi:Exostosin-2 [Aphelenchoides besseyi]|nr:Exostosin-2 [Aphelenchoides besseyi]KAI6229508.1 Exostosin-2 [Aphelenchoides besseyi]